MYIFRKEIDAPAWLWESNCIEQSGVWADLNEFRFILDIPNEVRVISGEEKRAKSLLSFHVYSISCLAHCRFRNRGVVLCLWEASMNLPSFQLCLSSLSSQSPQGLIFLIEEAQTTSVLPFWLLHLQSPNPISTSLLLFFQCAWQHPPFEGFSLLKYLGNLCCHFYHRLWSKGYKLVDNSFLNQYQWSLLRGIEF